MNIAEFINKYCDNSYRGYVEEIFEMKEGLDSFPIPEGFELLVEICRYPEFAIFVNKKDKAILICDEDSFSLSIYDDLVVWEVVIEKHRKYYKDAFVTQWFNLVSIDAIDDTTLFYEGGNYLGGTKGFYYTKQFENVRSQYEYSLDDIKQINPNLKINKTPWYLIIEEGSEGNVKDWHSQIHNPILSTGDFEEIHNFLFTHRYKE